MAKTLLVKYTPRVDSHTEKLVKAFLELAEGKTEIELLDLVQTPPEFLLAGNLNAYVKRNFNRQELSEEELQHILGMDELTDQVQDATHIVLAYPIYNFFLPAAVKAWIDSIAQSGKMFRYTDYGAEGYLGDKKALVLNVSSLTLQNSTSDFSTPYIKYLFNFMGVKDVTVTGLYGAKYTGVTPEMLAEFKGKLENLLKEWY